MPDPFTDEDRERLDQARVYERPVGRYVWIDFEDIHAIRHITNNVLEAKEEWAVERIIDAFWHTDPERPVARVPPTALKGEENG